MIDNHLDHLYSVPVSSRMGHSESPKIINLGGVSVFFKNCKALKSVKLSIRKGDFLFITGPSGAGKTTLMRVLSNEIPKEFLKGRVVFKEGIKTAEVYQDLKFLSDFTLRENLDLAYDTERFSNYTQFSRELDQLSSFLSLKGALDSKITELNRGSVQKAAVVRALLSKPDVLCADEPTCSLDWESTSAIYEILKYYNKKKNLTIVWTTHSQKLVERFSEKNIFLRDGVLVREGRACLI